MNDDEESRNAKAVSDFLQKSCQTRPTECLGFADFYRGLSYPMIHPVDGLKCKVFPTSTGSAAEFYIEPMLSCIGDTDVMYHYSNELAIPAWYPPPSRLPKEFENRVKVYEIVDSRMPGYVHLNLIYILRKNMCDGNYTVAEYVSSPSAALSHALYVTSKDGAKIHGPAYKTGDESGLFSSVLGETDIKKLMADTVPCIRSFAWPPQAFDWPKRQRNFDWPDSATVDRVVSQGCDVVGVAHCQCRQDEWLSKHQWRISFSRAEVVLLNSWMPEQQTVYHMIRVFLKNEQLIDSAADSTADTLSNYHIKTLMLWACELKPKKWWSDGSTLLSKCVQLLQFLEKWFTNRGQHYFINSVHFLDHFDKFHIEKVLTLVRETTEGKLAQWFIDNYIRKCAELCPGNTLLLCSDLFTSNILDNTVDMILCWRDHISRQFQSKRLFLLFFSCIVPLIVCFQIAPVDVLAIAEELHVPFAQSFPRIDERMSFSFMRALIKWFAEKKPTNFPLYDVLVTVFSLVPFRPAERCTVFRRFCYLDSNESQYVSHFKKAVIFMETVANNQLNARGLLQIELSKIFLHRALELSNSKHDSLHRLLNMYLTVLNYTDGEYQKASDHCNLVTRSKVHSQSSLGLHPVEGNLLPKIDDDIDSVLGLVVFYQYVQILALNQQQKQERNVNVFTTEMFAHYFSIKCLLVARCRLMPKGQEEQSFQVAKLYFREEVKLFLNTLMSTPRLLVSDLMLCKLPNNSTVITAYDSRRQLINLMTQLSLEQLLKYRDVFPRDTMSIDVCDITDFTALYLYRCGLYERCEQLCEQRICDLTDSHSCSIPHVSSMYHEFLRLMDDDVVSLIGLTVLLNKERAQSSLRKNITVTQLALYLYLLTKCQTNKCCLSPDDTATTMLSPLAVTLDWIAEAQKSIPDDNCVDHFMLKLAERKLLIEIMHQFTREKKKRPTCELEVSWEFKEKNGVLQIVTTIGVVLRYELPNGFTVAKKITRHFYS